MMQGLDLSPYFLAVEAQKEEKLSRPKPIRWVHANGEATGLSSDSFDLVSLAYVVNFYQIQNLLLYYMDLKSVVVVTTNLSLYSRFCGVP
jgi:ubiquinone/menaquinone biosynthesis C-methylase UbiE